MREAAGVDNEQIKLVVYKEHTIGFKGLGGIGIRALNTRESIAGCESVGDVIHFPDERDVRNATMADVGIFGVQWSDHWKNCVVDESEKKIIPGYEGNYAKAVHLWRWFELQAIENQSESMTVEDKKTLIESVNVDYRNYMAPVRATVEKNNNREVGENTRNNDLSLEL